MEQDTEKKLNPWLSMWFRPRITIQQITDETPTKCVLLIGALIGCQRLLGWSTQFNLGDWMEFTTVLLAVLILGPFIGIIYLYLETVIMRWSGQWFGGEGSSKKLRAAIAWSYVPPIVTLLLTVPILAIIGEEAFMEKTPVMDENLHSVLCFLVFCILALLFGLWNLVLSVKCVSQVQKFSTWKAIVSVFCSKLVIALSTILVAFTFYSSEEHYMDENIPEVTLELRAVKDAEPFDPANLENEVLISNYDIEDTGVTRDQVGNFQVSLSMTEDGTKKFGDITARLVGRHIAIIVDGEIMSTPKVQGPIRGGNAVITGDFTFERAADIAQGIMKHKYMLQNHKLQNTKVAFDQKGVRTGTDF